MLTTAPTTQSFLGIDWSEVRQAYRVFLKNPAQGILHILAAGAHSPWQHWVEQRKARQGALLAFNAIQIDLEALAQLPETTLGGAYARHMIAQGLDPQAFIRPDTQTSWVKQRLALSHDVHHLIVGFDSSPRGEFGLAAFTLLQNWDLLNVFVLSFLPYALMGNPKILGAVLRGLYLGWKAPALFAYPFEANWHKSLQEVRQETGIL